MSITLNRGPGQSRLPADTVCRRVREQHVELRQLLMSGLDHVRAALAGQQSAHMPLRLLVGVTYQVFVEHLSEEEALVFPILEDDLPVGPRRAELLREEHAKQLGELTALCMLREDDDELANRFSRLANSLLEDMEDEERSLLIPEVLRDDGVVIDQCGG
jgi:Hemerythrin HHE cation binding domain